MKNTRHGESSVTDVVAVSGTVTENTCSSDTMEKSCIGLSDEFAGTSDKEAAFVGGPMLDADGSVVGMRNIFYNSSTAELQHMTNADAIMQLLDEKKIAYLSSTSSGSLPIPVFIAGGAIALLLVCFGILKKKKRGKSPTMEDETLKQSSTRVPQPEETASVEKTQQLSSTQQGLELFGLRGIYQGQSFPLEKEIIFGRDATCCHIVFENTAGISRQHCMVRMDHGHCMLQDLHATYGTFHNHRKLADGEEVRLQIGDICSLGNEENSFQLRKRDV